MAISSADAFLKKIQPEQTILIFEKKTVEHNNFDEKFFFSMLMFFSNNFHHNLIKIIRIIKIIIYNW